MDATASSYTYMVNNGRLGVIACDSKMERLLLVGSGYGRKIPCNIIADGLYCDQLVLFKSGN